MLSGMTRAVKLWAGAVTQPRQLLTHLRQPRSLLLTTLAHARQGMVDVSQADLISYLAPGVEIEKIEALLREVRGNASLQRNLERYETEKAKAPRGAVAYGMSYVEAEAIYALVRISNPNSIVETGVSAGVSSTFILQALEKNEKGKLYSIDFPATGVIEDSVNYWRPPGMDTGWMVPDSLRGRWRLILGKSEDILGPLLDELGEIDIFLHDSLHTFPHMEFEYQTAWRFIRRGGYLLSHDVGTAYLRLCRSVDTVPIRHVRLGGTRRDPQED